MKRIPVLALLCGLALPVLAQQTQRPPIEPPTAHYPQLPASPEQVARPDRPGNIAGNARLQLVKVADGLYDPMNVVTANDGSGRLFIVERHGRILILQNGQVLKEPFLDISDLVVQAMLEQGLYDMAFHPNFKRNGKFYVHFSELMRNGDSVIVEYTVSKTNRNKADPKSARLIMVIEQPWANHNGGEIEFGPDGYLYIGSGDGGWEGDPLNAGQRLDTLLGKILRIDVNVPEGSYDRYAIPRDNPFTQREELIQLFGVPEDVFAAIHTDVRPEIWAYGMRNPWKFHFDPGNGDIYVAEVGQNHWEEIDLIPKGAAGLNYGWDMLMGTHCHPINLKECPLVGVLPIAEYPHEAGSCAVIGIGVVRNNRALRELDGAYLFGDFCSGKIWGTRRGRDGRWEMQELLDTALQITGSGFDEKGNLYVTSCQCAYGQREATDTGSIWRVVRADQVPANAEVAPTGQPATPEQEPVKPEGEAQPQTQPTRPAAAERQSRAPAAGADATRSASASAEADVAAMEGKEAGGGDAKAVLAQGQRVFQTNCAVCHGGQGQGTIGPALANNERIKDVQYTLQFIVNGKNQMPAFRNQLSSGDIAAVASYIRSSWGNDYGTVSLQQVEAVKGKS